MKIFEVAGIGKLHGLTVMSLDSFVEKDSKEVEEAVEGRQKHKVAVTVSDPNHTAVSQRGETQQRMCSVTADGREQACDTAVKWYKKQGYRVHDHNYVGTVEDTVKEGVMSDLHLQFADVYDELAPGIEKHKDSVKAGQLHDALKAVAEKNGALGEFKRMMMSARNSAHQDYDTNPGGFENWFWYLPFGDLNESQIDEIDRRGFLKGLGAAAVTGAGAGLPTLAQAKGPGYWANYAGKKLEDATSGFKIKLRSADIEISTGDSVSPREYIATNVYDLVTKYCELTDCYNAKQAIDNATTEAIKISKIDSFVYRAGSDKQFVLAYRASLNDEVYEWKKAGKPAQKQEQPAPQQSAQQQPQKSAPQEIKLNLKLNRQVGDIVTVKGGVADGKKAKVTQILGPNKEGTGNKGLGVVVESVNQNLAEGWKGAVAGGIAGGMLGGPIGAVIGGAGGYVLGGGNPNEDLPDDIESAYELGQQAARDGKTDEDNPYEEGWSGPSEEMEAWHEGWESVNPGVAEASNTMQRYGQLILKRAKAAREAEARERAEQEKAEQEKAEKEKKPGVAEAKADLNFSVEDLKRLERIRDLPTLKAQAFALISAPSAKPMKPEKVEWFKGALERMNSPLKVIKLMYDLMLSGEGHSVIGSRSSMNPNSYRQRFSEQGVAEGGKTPKQYWNRDSQSIGSTPDDGLTYADPDEDGVQYPDYANTKFQPQAKPTPTQATSANKRLTDKQYAKQLHKHYARFYGADKLRITFNRRKNIFSVTGNNGFETDYIKYRVNPTTNILQKMNSTNIDNESQQGVAERVEGGGHLKNKDDLRAKRKAIQDILMDPTMDADTLKRAQQAKLDLENQAEKIGMAEGKSDYKIKSIGTDSKGDYYISPSTGEKVYKSGVKRGDHENPNTGEIKKNIAEAPGDFGLGANYRAVPDAEMQDLMGRSKNKTKTKRDKFDYPYIHGSNIQVKDEGGKTFDAEALKKSIMVRPGRILGQNAKMQHSETGTEAIFDIGLPALKGLAVNEKTGEFVVVDTCPGAGACKTFCYAMKGSYVMFKAVSMGLARMLNFLLNDPAGFASQLNAEIAGAQSKMAKKNAKVVVRWHDAGDFFSAEYLDMAYSVANANPDVGFYAYTKMADVATGQRPKNFNMNFSGGAVSSQEKKIDFKRTKHSKVVPKDMFFDLIARDGISLKKDAKGRMQFASPENLDQFKSIMAQKYAIDKDSILTYDEMMKTPVGDTPKWNTIVMPGDGDNSANRNDVIGSYLLFH